MYTSISYGVVSIHAPARGATGNSQAKGAEHMFQFTLPRGERLTMRGMPVVSSLFQFTLPRGERPLG